MNPIDLWTTPNALALWNIDGERPQWTNERGGRFRLCCRDACDKLWYCVEMWRGHGGSGWECDFTPEDVISLALLCDDSRERLERAGLYVVSYGDGQYNIRRPATNEWLWCGLNRRVTPSYDEALLAGRKAMKEQK